MLSYNSLLKENFKGSLSGHLYCSHNARYIADSIQKEETALQEDLFCANGLLEQPYFSVALALCSNMGLAHYLLRILY